MIHRRVCLVLAALLTLGGFVVGCAEERAVPRRALFAAITKIVAPGPRESPPIPDDAVVIEVGQNAQDVVDAHPPGTTFVFETGTHRLVSILVRDGDAFLGQPGAILDGSVVIEGFERDGTVWVAEGLELVERYTGEMDEGFAREGLRHDLYYDGAFLRHVESADAVGSGTWFYDFDADLILLGQDPADAEVELSLTYEAFWGADGTRDVHISDLRITQYATPPQFGPINGLDTIDWTVEHVEVTHNHGAAIRFGHGMHIRDSVLADNGQIGVTGADDFRSDRSLVVERNEILGNGLLGFTWFWEKGGVKVVGTTNAQIRGNRIVNNIGPGVWFDIDNDDAVVADNEIRHNSIMGVFFELSDGLLVTGNIIRNNGWALGELNSAGVNVSNASDVTVRNNVLSRNSNEMTVVIAERENMGPDPTGVLVEDNDITISEGFVGVSILSGDEQLYDPGVMRFRDNRYVLDGCEPCFFWDTEITTEEWLAIGHDQDSTFAEPS